MNGYTLQATPDEEALSGYSDLERILLKRRSITSPAEAHEFLNPSYDTGVHDPHGLPDVNKSVKRLLKAVRNGEHVAIFSDYDADGVCGASLWKSFFDRVGYERVTYYIPHRHEEGFGLSTEAIEQFIAEGVSLVITTDCGIADIKAVENAVACGLDVIITDHHEPPVGPDGSELLPPAYAVIDPKISSSRYPFSDLCGTAIAFKFIQAVLAEDRLGLPEGHEKWFLDVVGIATLSDMVPLRGENRIFARYGLMVLRRSRRVGLIKLCRKLGITQRVMNEDDIGFMITPRLNAGSRMGNARDAFTLLTTESDVEAQEMIDRLEHVNNERKGVVASIVKEIKQVIGDTPDSDVIVVGNPKWRPSLLGLAANTIAEEYSRPVFLWGRDGTSAIKGSCRSDGRTCVFSLMQTAGDAFVQFGGHVYAGGFSVEFDSVHLLHDHLNKAYKENGNVFVDEDTVVDATVRLDDVNERTVRTLERFAPFGVGNEKPIFLIEDATVSSVSLFGKQKNHLKVILSSASGHTVEAIAFFRNENDLSVPVEVGRFARVIASIERSMFAGRSSIRLRLIDSV